MRFTLRAFIGGAAGTLGALAAIVGVSTVVAAMVQREIRAAAREVLNTDRHSRDFLRDNPEAKP